MLSLRNTAKNNQINHNANNKATGKNRAATTNETDLAFLRNSRYSNNMLSNTRACFTITLREGRNRQIRRMCEARGLRVLELHRESVMGIGLGGLQGEGWWAYLTEEEEEEVKEAVEQWERKEG
eukprot:evm.model.NODE_15532_length_3741_cov_12.010960.1